MIRQDTIGTLGRPVAVAIELGVALALLLLSPGCGCDETPSTPGRRFHTASGFPIYWPPADPAEAPPKSLRPLLTGTLTLDAQEQPPGETEVRLAVTLTRPSTEDDRNSWNTVLAYGDVPWMEEVRVWDAQRQWLWPNLPYLLRLPGRERVERYGGVDPGKGVDNDFAAVLIRKYDAQGVVESDETEDAPLVSAEWHAPDAAATDGHSIVHVAKSDEFLLHLGGTPRGRLKVWVVYADFLYSNPPLAWPREGEWAGGILAYFEVDWETSSADGYQCVIRHKRPEESTRFEWSKWVVRTRGADEAQAEVRLSDRREGGSL